MTFWVAGAAVVGAGISASAANDASNKQAASSQNAQNLTDAQYAQNREDQAPYRLSGNAALAQYDNLLGIKNASVFDTAKYLAAYPDVAKDPYYSQHAYEHFQTRGAAENRQGYWVDPSTDASTPEFGSYAQPIKQSEVMLDPGYQFGLQQGQQAIDRKTAAAGGRISGAALKAAAQYGTDYGTTGYSTAYNRVNQARTDRLNRLAALAGIGQTATQQVGSAGQAASAQTANIITAQGNASAAGQLAQGNIWGNAGNQIAALYGRNSSAPTQTYNPGAYSSTGGDYYYGAGQNWGV